MCCVCIMGGGGRGCIAEYRRTRNEGNLMIVVLDSYKGSGVYTVHIYVYTERERERVEHSRYSLESIKTHRLNGLRGSLLLFSGQFSLLYPLQKRALSFFLSFFSDDVV